MQPELGLSNLITPILIIGNSIPVFPNFLLMTRSCCLELFLDFMEWLDKRDPAVPSADDLIKYRLSMITKILISKIKNWSGVTNPRTKPL